MRLQVLSDLHLEVCPFAAAAAPADVVVLAGDLHEGTRGLEWSAQAFPRRPIVHVPGNHECYDGEFSVVREAMRRRARELGIVHLDYAAAVVQGVRFIGATLWADLLLYGAEGKAALLSRGLDRLVEYRCVRFDGGPFTPEHSVALHAASRAFLERALDEPFDGRTIVTSPTRRSPRISPALWAAPTCGSTATRTPASITRSPARACSPTRAAIPAATR